MGNKKEDKNLSKKEFELLETYNESPEEYEEVEEYKFSDENESKEKEKKTELKTTKKKNNTLLNILFIVMALVIVIICTDIIAVKKFKAGPFFAIPIKTYEDGSKEYYGIGYKVIDYKQEKGRKDKVIGTWGLKYNDEVIIVEAIDLAIDFNDNESITYDRYKDKFLRVTGILTNVSTNNNMVTLSYIDEDGKYNFDIICKMSSDSSALESLEMNLRATVTGTVSGYDYKSPETKPTLHLKDCNIEQDV